MADEPRVEGSKMGGSLRAPVDADDTYHSTLIRFAVNLLLAFLTAAYCFALGFLAGSHG